MNEQETKWAEGLYVLQDGFTKLGDKMFEKYKPILKIMLREIWKYLDDAGVTNEALRYAVRQECLSMLATSLEYNTSIYADRLRDFSTSVESMKETKKRTIK